MDRREFFNASIIGTIAAKVLSDTTLARAQTPAAAAQGGSPAAAGAPRKLIMDAYTRHLHWLRNPDEIAEAAIEMTCGGVEPTVQNYPGHIDPTKVTTDLPAFVKTMQKHGLRVKQIRGGNQTAVDASVESLVGAMSQSGATHYWLGTDNYDLAKPMLPQLDAIKVKVERFVKLNEKHGTTLMYHTRAGANSVGSVVWDLLYVMAAGTVRRADGHCLRQSDEPDFLRVQQELCCRRREFGQGRGDDCQRDASRRAWVGSREQTDLHSERRRGHRDRGPSGCGR